MLNRILKDNIESPNRIPATYELHHDIKVELKDALKMCMMKVMEFEGYLAECSFRRKDLLRHKINNDVEQILINQLYADIEKSRKYNLYSSRHWQHRYYKLRGWDLPKKAKSEMVKYNIEYIKKKINMKSILGMYGIEQGISKKIQCLNPMHNDTTPSMHVYEHNTYCYSCNKSYDTIAVVQLLEPCTFRESLRKINEL